MIPLATIRAAHRRKTVAYISAEPCPARLNRAAGVTVAFNVRTSEPLKSRDMKNAGFTPGVTLECQAALPIGTARPEPEKERLEVVDLGGEWRVYDLMTVTPLQGTDCYRLGLRVRNGVPTGTAPTLQ